MNRIRSKVQEDCGYEVIILTTNISNGNKMISELIDPLPSIPISSNE